MMKTFATGRLSQDWLFKQIRFYNVAARSKTQESVLKAVAQNAALLSPGAEHRENLTPEERDRARKFLELFLEAQKVKVCLKPLKKDE